MNDHTAQGHLKQIGVTMNDLLAEDPLLAKLVLMYDAGCEETKTALEMFADVSQRHEEALRNRLEVATEALAAVTGLSIKETTKKLDRAEQAFKLIGDAIAGDVDAQGALETLLTEATLP